MARKTEPLVPEDIPPDEVNALLGKLAEGIVRRRMTTPAILALEMCRPLNFVGSQVMIALNPFVAAFFDASDYRKVALLLERDENLDRLLHRIEELDADVQRRERDAKRTRNRDDASRPRRLRAILSRFRRR
jgi:hypothetical protein